ncbi:MAG TPA: hypothetical protein VGQ78_08465 [Vicinamibacteria bacterium]|nr:hypothetical protein [Vicinamibacteria bacterium]
MRALRAAALYVALSFLLTFPLPLKLRIMDAGDAAFFCWAIGWEVHALETDLRLLPHGNMFHPLRYTLGMDEPILGTTVLVLPLAVFTRDAVFLANVARLLTFPLSALAAYLLARTLGCGEGPSLIAGAAFAFSPIRTDQIAHLSTLGTQWLPLVPLFIVRFFRAGQARDAALAAAAFVLAALACGYHAVTGLIVLPAFVLPLLWGRWRRLPVALAGAAAAGIALLPLYALHRAALAPLQYTRNTAETAEYSAAIETFFSSPSWNRVWAGPTAAFRDTHSNNLFPGAVLPLLALAGAWSLLRRRERPSREALALVLMALAAVLVALGPEIRLFGRTLLPGPFALARLLPTFRMIRVPSRVGAYLALALAMLAAKGLGRLRLGPAALTAIGALALAETVIAPIPMPAWAQVVDSRRPPPPVYAWLAAQPDDPVVVELPMQDINGLTERPAFHESIYLVHSTRHWRRLANGYAGIEPAPYVELREKARRFPSAASLDALRERGVRYVILHRGGYGPNRWDHIQRDLPLFADRLRPVGQFDADTVFELVR